MMNRTGILVVIFSFLSLASFAQDKKTLSLQEAIDLSVKNSKQLKIGQARIDGASAAVKEATEKKLPSASISGSYLRLTTANIDLKSKSSNNNGNSGSTPKVNQAMYGLLNASMPLYMGGKIKYGIESSKYLEKAAELDVENDKDGVIQNTIEAFANLFKATTAVKLVKENLEEARQRAKDFSNLEKNGVLARNDLLKAELQASNTELNLLDADNNLQLANVNMDLMLGLPTTTQLVLDTSGIEKKNDNRVLDDYINAALTNRDDLSALGYRKKAAETGVKIALADKYPALQLTGGYIAADIPRVFSVSNAVNFGVGVSYNIASLWKTKSKVQQAQAKVMELQTTADMMDDAIKLEVSRSYLSLLSNRKKIEVYAKAMEQAAENYRIVKNKFDNGLATATELLDADTAKLQATLSYTLAKADTFVAYNKLLETTGTLADDIKK